MTWTIRLTYEIDDDPLKAVNIQQKITDHAVDNSYFHVLTWQFERMVEAMKKQMQEEKS
jgi:hypothetical protein